MNFRKNLVLLLILVVAVLLVFFLERPFKKDTEKADEHVKALFPALKIEEVKKVEIRRPKEKNLIVLQRIDQSWYVTEAVPPANADSGAKPDQQSGAAKDEAEPQPEKAAAGQQLPAQEPYPADQDAVKEALEKMQSLKEDNLASRNKDKHGLFEVTGGSAIEVAAFNSKGQELGRLFVGKEGPDFFSNYIRKVGSDIVYLYPNFLKGNFDRQLDNWRNRKIFDFAAADVAGLKIAKKNETLTLQKGDTGEWRIEQPIQAEADGTKITSIVSSLSTLTAGKFADAVTAEQAGLDSPEAELTVTFKDGSTRLLLVGEKKEENFYYVKAGDQKYIYEAYKSVVDTLMPSLQDLEKQASASAAPAVPPAKSPVSEPSKKQ